MCEITQHAIDRMMERFNVKHRPTAEQILRDNFDKSELVGEFYDDEHHGKRRLYIHRESKQILVTDPDTKALLTVYRTKVTNIAHELYEDVMRLHVQKMRRIDRERSQVIRRFAKRRKELETERDTLDGEIEELQRRLYELQTRRGEIDEELHAQDRTVAELESRKKYIVHSIANVM